MVRATFGLEGVAPLQGKRFVADQQRSVLVVRVDVVRHNNQVVSVLQPLTNHYVAQAKRRAAWATRTMSMSCGRSGNSIARYLGTLPIFASSEWKKALGRSTVSGSKARHPQKPFST